MEINNLEEIKKLTQEEEEKNEKESRWMKPAKDILTGIEKSSSVVPERPIWELVQNARDLAIGKASIIFKRKNEEFTFFHDGEPFTDKTIRGLITQTSTKLREDKTKVGQYGTGFLTTHRFGRNFKLSGSLYAIEGSEYYYNFKDFEINRSAADEMGMMDALEKQIIEKESFKTKYIPTKDATQITLFSYTQNFQDEKDNVKLAFQDAQKYIPYVLSLNPTLQSITFIDEIDNYTVCYNKKGDLEPLEENLWIQKIEIVNNDEPLEKEIYLLKSVELTENNDNQYSIILPIENDRAIQLSGNIARLFLYLPLIGTNEFGANFIINSPVFECEENRDQLWLDGTADAIKKKVKGNRDILLNASELLLKYYDSHIENINDAIFLSRIYFNKNKKGSDDYKEFLSTIQIKWINRFSDYKIVDINANEEKGKPSEIKILDKNLINICESDNIFFDYLYEIIVLYYTQDLPTKSTIIEWSKIIEEWYMDIDNAEYSNEVLSIDSFLQHIHKSPDSLSVDHYDNLIHIYRAIIENGFLAKLEGKNLIPSINNVFLDKDHLLIPQNLSPEIISIISVFLKGEVDRFVNHKFATLLKYTDYSKDSIENDIKIYVSNKNRDIDEAEKLMEDFSKLKDSEITNFKQRISNLLISNNERNSLLDFCNYVVKANSDSFFRTVTDLMSEFYDYKLKYSSDISDEFEYRLIVRILLRNTFLDLANRDYDWQNDYTNKEKLIKLLTTVQNYEDFKKLNNNARLYLSQNGKLDYAKNRRKELNINIDLKRIYQAVTEKDINDLLIDNDFENCYDYSDLICNASDLSNEIFSVIEDEKFPDIRNNEYKDIIIELTEKITEESDLEEDYKQEQKELTDDLKYWTLLFKDIAREKEHITMFKIRQPELKKSMFKIMRTTPERVQLLARLSTDPRLEEIVEYGRRSLFEEKNRDHDFRFKTILGKYIEDFLKKELESEFTNISFEYENYENVVTKNQQGGQDIIIKKGGIEIFFIEIKSRWSSRPSVTMSPLQMDTSIKRMDKYALCAVNMYGSNLEDDALKKSEDDTYDREHLYPPFIEIKPRIRVLLDIGKRNETLLNENNKLKANIDNVVSLTGDYRALIPQKLLNSDEADDFDKLLQIIKSKIQSI